MIVYTYFPNKTSYICDKHVYLQFNNFMMLKRKVQYPIREKNIKY